MASMPARMIPRMSSWNNVYPKEFAELIFSRLREATEKPLFNGSYCFEYTEALTEKGYARPDLTVDGVRYRVYGHRLMVELRAKRRLDKHAVVLHLCDNPKCCCPWHLKVGTIHENNLDRDLKGRRGVARGHTRMTAEQALRVKMALRQRRNTESICSEVGCTSKAVRDIRAGRTWASLKLAKVA